MRTSGSFLAGLAALMLATTASATPITLTDGNSSYFVDVEENSEPLGASSWIVNGNSSLYEDWFWLRFDDSFAIPFNDLVLVNEDQFAANGLTVELATQQGAEILVTYFLSDLAAGNSQMNQTVQIANSSNEPLSFVFYHYVDYDLFGDFDDTSLQLLGPGSMFQVDGDATALYSVIFGPMPDRFEMDFYNDLRDRLDSEAGVELADATNPLGFGDHTFAFQWNVTLDPEEIFEIGIQQRLSAIPEPSSLTLAALGLGIGATLGLRRFRRRPATTATAA